jgi:hypothetical protein
MKAFSLALGLVYPLMVFSSAIIDEEVARKRGKQHIFINETGAVVDEEVLVDKENGIVVLNVPAHHDVVPSTVVYDKNSPWMMQVLPRSRECQYMMQPPSLNKMGVNVYDVEKLQAKTSKDHPIPISPMNTIEIDTIIKVGPLKDRTTLPTKFQQHCPKDFDVRSAHMHEVGKEDSDILYSDTKEFENEEDFFENGVPNLIGNHTRRKRASCEMFGNHIEQEHCIRVLEAQCGATGNCPLVNILYHCRRNDRSHSCSYLTLPCTRMIADPKVIATLTADQLRNILDPAFCLVHMTNINENCNACCTDTKCQGTGGMPHCNNDRVDWW